MLTLHGCAQGWEELMMVVESAMAGGRREVALAAIAVITQMMQAHGGTPAVARPMWKRALRAVGVGVEAAASPHCLLPVQACPHLLAVAAEGSGHELTCSDIPADAA